MSETTTLPTVPQPLPKIVSCHHTFTDKKVSRPTFPWVSLTKMTKMVQWLILNNSHAYPFCKTTPGTQLFSIGHCTIFCQWNLLKTVAKLFSQWKSGCTNCLSCSSLLIDKQCVSSSKFQRDMTNKFPICWTFLKMGQLGHFFCLFCLFIMSQFKNRT